MLARKHLGRTDAVAQLLLAPTRAVLASQLPCERREDLLSVTRALTAQHVISNATTLPQKRSGSALTTAAARARAESIMRRMSVKRDTVPRSIILSGMEEPAGRVRGARCPCENALTHKK